jgi:hypothetical protein
MNDKWNTQRSNQRAVANTFENIAIAAKILEKTSYMGAQYLHFWREEFKV